MDEFIANSQAAERLGTNVMVIQRLIDGNVLEASDEGVSVDSLDELSQRLRDWVSEDEPGHDGDQRINIQDVLEFLLPPKPID